jgi:hypothetical protein
MAEINEAQQTLKNAVLRLEGPVGTKQEKADLTEMATAAETFSLQVPYPMTFYYCLLIHILLAF